MPKRRTKAPSPSALADGCSWRKAITPSGVCGRVHARMRAGGQLQLASQHEQTSEVLDRNARDLAKAIDLGGTAGAHAMVDRQFPDAQAQRGGPGHELPPEALLQDPNLAREDRVQGRPLDQDVGARRITQA